MKRRESWQKKYNLASSYRQFFHDFSILVIRNNMKNHHGERIEFFLVIFPLFTFSVCIGGGRLLIWLNVLYLLVDLWELVKVENILFQRVFCPMYNSSIFSGLRDFFYFLRELFFLQQMTLEFDSFILFLLSETLYVLILEDSRFPRMLQPVIVVISRVLKVLLKLSYLGLMRLWSNMLIFEIINVLLFGFFSPSIWQLCWESSSKLRRDLVFIFFARILTMFPFTCQDYINNLFLLSLLKQKLT